MSIDSATLEQIRAQAQIADVIGQHLELKRKGRTLWALCPFHNEKSPSFAISEEGGFYKCFGCEAKGDVFSFLINYLGINYLEAVKQLAEKYGIPLINLNEKDQAEKEEAKRKEEGLYLLLEVAKTYYETSLADPVAQNYLKKRAIPEKIFKQFNLGYSLPSWNAFHHYALKKGYTKEQLERAGLITSKKGSDYDRFRGRLMFPIHNPSGKVVGFGGRSLHTAATGPKYLNSPESKIYQKSQLLYGLYQAKQSIRKERVCYIVEGYMDLLAFHKAGISHVVAISGTALTVEQLQLLKKYTPQLIFCLDNDLAGQRATLRALNLALEQGFSTSILQFPGTKDPDSYLTKEGSKAFLLQLQSSVDFIDFTVNHIREQDDYSDKSKITAATAAIKLLAAIEDPIKQDVYLSKLAKLLDIEKNILANKLYSTNKEVTIIKRPKVDPKLPIESIQSQYEKRLLKFLLTYAHEKLKENLFIADYLYKELGDMVFQEKNCQEIWEDFYKDWQQKPGYKVSDWLGSRPKEQQKWIIDLLATKYQISDWEKFSKKTLPTKEKTLSKESIERVLTTKLLFIKKLLLENAIELEKVTDEKNLNEAIEKELKLHQIFKKIATELGIVISS